ncbi:hypothetical protein B0H63DRAFT_565263 [Podospora didyma]|uniref:Zn(2)-C6 fungal-type domain-containing protein n=1 Tax=Podospora didyma TaxID=330526 RepID=A0AAE0N405_9PEZI|nr:hypothetical protein B0H63DRAFT_565263 [Podospora didyma]
MQDVACTNCRNRKIRCGRERPRCGSCARDRVECVYSTPAKRVNHVKVLCQGFDDIQSRLRLVQEELSTLTAMFKSSRIADGLPANFAASLDATHTHMSFGGENDGGLLAEGHLVRDDGTSLEKYHGPWTLLAVCRDFGMDLGSRFGHESVPGKLVGQMWLDAGNDIRRGFAKSDGPGQDVICLPSRQFLSVVLDNFFNHDDHSTDIFVRATFQKAVERAYSEPSSPASEAWAVCFNLIILLVIGAEHGIGKQDPFIQPLLQAAHAATQKPTIFLSLRLVNVQALALLSLLAQQSHSETLGDSLFAQACMLAKAMGLHHAGQGLSVSPFSAEEIEERQKVFRSLYIRDRAAALTRGTPLWLPRSNLKFPPLADPTSITIPNPSSPETPARRYETNRVAWYELATLQSELHHAVFDESTQTSIQERRLSLVRLRQSLQVWSQKHAVPSSTVPAGMDEVSLHLAFLGTRIRTIDGHKLGGADADAAAQWQASLDARISCLLMLVSCSGRRDERLVEQLEQLLRKRRNMSGETLVSNANTKPGTPASSPSSPTGTRAASESLKSQSTISKLSSPLGIQRLTIFFPTAALFTLARNILGIGPAASRRNSLFQSISDQQEERQGQIAEDIALLRGLHACFRDAAAVVNSDPDNHAVKVGRVIQVLVDIVSAVLDPASSNTDPIDPLLTSAISPILGSPAIPTPSNNMVAQAGASRTSYGQLDAATLSHLVGSGSGNVPSPSSSWANPRNGSMESLSTGSSTSASMPMVSTPEMTFDISQFIDQMGANSLSAMWGEDQPGMAATPTQLQQQQQDQSILETTPTASTQTTRKKGNKRVRTSFSLEEDEGSDYMQTN